EVLLVDPPAPCAGARPRRLPRAAAGVAGIQAGLRDVAADDGRRSLFHRVGTRARLGFLRPPPDGGMVARGARRYLLARAGPPAAGGAGSRRARLRGGGHGATL